jgi:hypothetical protein
VILQGFNQNVESTLIEEIAVIKEIYRNDISDDN